MGLPLDPTTQTCGAAQLGRCVRVVPGDAACSELDGGAFFLALLTRTKEADPAGQRRHALLGRVWATPSPRPCNGLHTGTGRNPDASSPLKMGAPVHICTVT